MDKVRTRGLGGSFGPAVAVTRGPTYVPRDTALHSSSSCLLTLPSC